MTFIEAIVSCACIAVVCGVSFAIASLWNYISDRRNTIVKDHKNNKWIDKTERLE